MRECAGTVTSAPRLSQYQCKCTLKKTGRELLTELLDLSRSLSHILSHTCGGATTTGELTLATRDGRFDFDFDRPETGDRSPHFIPTALFSPSVL